MNVLIVSLRYNPGHFSHLVATYKLFEEIGYTPYLYVNRRFEKMDEKCEYKKYTSGSDLYKKLGTIDVAVFWFPSIKNIVEIIRFRVKYKSKVIYIFHEPFDSIKNYFNSGFGVKKIIKICLINIVNIPTIFFSNSIVLPSNTAYNLYLKKYNYINKNASVIPLIFDDEAKSIALAEDSKKYISYIGTVAADHAFDCFLNFIELAINEDWYPSMTFVIATASKLSLETKKRLDPFVNSGKLIITEGTPMSISQINLYYRKSLVIWNAYHRSIQSGVLPKAFMFGTAVIVVKKNANEFHNNFDNCILISDNKSIVEIKEGIDLILSNKESFFYNARKKFLETFYYRNRIESFRKLIQS